MILPNYFTLDVDGTFESLYYTKKTKKSFDDYYYSLNLCHCIAQSSCRGFEQQYNLPLFDFINEDSKSVLPYPLHFAIPKPVVIDLSQKYERKDLEKVRSFFKDKSVSSYIGRDLMGLMSIWVEDRSKDLVEKTFNLEVPQGKKYSLAKKVISKMLRTTHEFEYFDHNSERVKKYPIIEHQKNRVNKKKKSSTTTNPRVDERQGKIEEYIDSFSVNLEKVWKLKQLIQRVKRNTINTTIFRSFTWEVEEIGFLWIVGERNGFLVGVSMKIFSNNG